MLKVRLTTWTIIILAVTACSATAQEKPALSASQKQALQEAKDAGEKTVKAQVDGLTAKVGEIAKRMNRNILSETPDEELHRKLSVEFAGAVAELVSAAIQSRLSVTREIVKVLTPEQKKALLAEIEKPGANPDLTELIGKAFSEPKK